MFEAAKNTEQPWFKQRKRGLRPRAPLDPALTVVIQQYVLWLQVPRKEGT